MLFPKKLRHILTLSAKTIAWICVGVALFIVGLATTVVKWLTPERLTPIVRMVGSSYLNADVDVSRVELSFWSTFPHLTLEVDSLCIVSRSLHPLDSIERSSLPPGADTLATLTNLHGGVNVLKLAIGKIGLYDVAIDEPMLRLVSVNDSVTNYNILPPSEPDTTAKEPPSIPDISINRFAITRAKPFSYTSIADNFHGSVTLNRVEIGSGDSPHYQLALAGDCASPLINEYNFRNINLGIDGKIRWTPDEPMAIGLDDFGIEIDEIKSQVSTDLSFADELTVKSLDFRLKPVAVSSLVKHVPSALRGVVNPLHTDMKISAKVQLKEPYTITDKMRIPDVDASIDIPRCNIAYQTYAVKGFGLKFDISARDGVADLKVKLPDCSAAIGQNEIKRIGLEALGQIPIERIDQGAVTVKRLVVEGPATSISLKGQATSLISDPNITCRLEADVDMNRFPAAIRQLIPGQVSGHLSADVDAAFKLSHLSLEQFHKMLLNGNVHLRNFRVDIPETVKAWVSNADFKLGSSGAFIVDNTTRVDSLLTASVKIDTASCSAGGNDITLSDFKAGVGTPNRYTSTNPKLINPIGGRLSVSRLTMYNSVDTLKLRLRGITCNASLRRYQGDAHVPELNLSLDAQRLSASNPMARFALRETHFDVTAHINPPRSHGNRQRQRTASPTPAAKEDNDLIDFGLDRSMKRLLRQWDVSGTFSAKRGRLYTPLIPLRNRLSDIDLAFNTDSIAIRSAGWEAGQSDFRLKGSISNIRRALTSRRGVPLRVNLSMNSDTINVNEIVQAIYAGGIMSDTPENPRLTSAMMDNENDNALETTIAETTVSTGPLIVPRNINAHFVMRARNIIYADIPLKRFKGEVGIYDGAINLNKLRAFTDIGSLDLTALYSAPDRHNIDFGMGVQIKDFNIKRFIQLFPAIDSIMPMLSGFRGYINADIAATTDVTPNMDIDIPSLRAAVKISGDSLVVLDEKTFRTISKWALFKNKKRNMIDHMSVEMLIEDSQLELFPFIFEMDRYRFGIMGRNDLALNLDYHISVLKSPIPFKFGINIKGNPDKMKIRLGGAKFKENMAAQRVAIVDTTRINLVNQIQSVFNRGLKAARLGRLNVGRPTRSTITDEETPLTSADSLEFISRGLIEAPPPASTPPPTSISTSVGQKGSKKRTKK